MTIAYEAAPAEVKISSSILMSDEERAEYERAMNAKIARETVPLAKRKAKIARDLSISATAEVVIPPTPAVELDPAGEFDDFDQLDYTIDDAIDWQIKAVCAETDPEIFFPEKGGSTAEALRVCRECTVRDKCLEYALKYDQRHGIWGGKTEPQRRRMQKNK